MTKTDKDGLLDRLSGCVGQLPFSAVAGPRNDYVLSIELGDKQRRTVRLSNPALSFLHRTYEGQYSFLVECPWRLDGPGGVVASCFEAFARDAPPSRELGELVEAAVESVRVIEPAWDLELGFAGGFQLRCFAAEVGTGRRRNNWTYWSPEGLLTVGPRGRVRLETRAEAAREVERLRRVLDEDQDLIAPLRGLPRPKDDEGDPQPPEDEET